MSAAVSRSLEPFDAPIPLAPCEGVVPGLGACAKLDLPIDREIIRFAGHRYAIRRGPIWGEPNEEIVREELGMDDESYTQLVLDGVLE